MPPSLPACIDTGSCSGMEPSATVRKYLHICISGNALSSYLTASNCKQRNEENRTTVWPGRGRVLHVGVVPPHHLAKTHGHALCNARGLGCSPFLWLSFKPAPNAKMLCPEDRKQLGKVTHLLFMSYGKAQVKSSLALHTFTALAICLSTNRMYQGTVC